VPIPNKQATLLIEPPQVDQPNPDLLRSLSENSVTDPLCHQSTVLLSGAGVQRSGTPAESKHPYVQSELPRIDRAPGPAFAHEASASMPADGRDRLNM